MKYKFKLTNTTAYNRPNGFLNRLKMFVGDEQAVQQGRWTNLNGEYKVSFNFKVQDKVYQVIVESPTYWNNYPSCPPSAIFDGNSDYNWMSDTSDPEQVWISVETDMPVTRFVYLNHGYGAVNALERNRYNDKLLLTEETTNTIIFDGNTPAFQTISVDVPMKLYYHNKNTFISFK